MSSGASSKPSRRAKRIMDRAPKEDLLERFHPTKKVCDIVATSAAEKIDPFYVFRPKSHKECLDYNISQTEAKMDCGPTKIHFSQIRAEYEKFPENFVFPVEERRRKRRQHGRGPVWLYADEIAERKIDRIQAGHKQELNRRTAIKKKIAHKEKKRMIGALVENSLPHWFQELSNEQMQSADDLQKAILKDTKQNTICNVKECIARLGLVLRPNSRNVERALKNCCKNPVAFLLLLRKYGEKAGKGCYNTNEKLLLSAVVHLIMPMLLREMHIRTPSPPPKFKEPSEIIPCTNKKPKYESPYLEPYTFERPPPKNTGIYKNRHIQYPESPYFSYLTGLYWDMYLNEVGSDEELLQKMKRSKMGTVRKCQKFPIALESPLSLTPIEIELNEERDYAQTIYNELFSGEITPKLLRASVYEKCLPKMPSPKDYATETDREESAEAEFHPDVVDDRAFADKEDKSSRDKDEKGEDEGEMSSATAVTTSSELSESYLEAEKYILSAYERYPMYSNVVPIYGGVTFDTNGNPVPIIAGLITPDLLCRCNKGSEKSLRIFKQKDDGTCRCIKRMRKKLERKERLEERKRLQKLLCTCDVCSCKERIPSTPSSVSDIPSFVPPSQDIYEKEKPPEVIEVKEPPAFHCHCKEFVEQFLAYKEQLDACEKKCTRKKQKPTFVVSSVTQDGKKIIDATKAKKECRCLQKYRERIAEFEKQDVIQRTQEGLKSTNRTFVISGVKAGEDGKPIFMLSGIFPGKPCAKCVELMEEEKREEQRKAEMPKFGTGRIKYQIAGVQKTAIGNVYIISGTVKTEPCYCMKLYETFMQKHSKCMQLYDRYVQKIDNETKQYLEEIRKRYVCPKCGTCRTCEDCRESLASVTTQLPLPLSKKIDPAFPTQPPVASSGQPAAAPATTTQPLAVSSGLAVKQGVPTQPPAASAGQPAKQGAPGVPTQPPAASAGQPAKQGAPGVPTQPPAASAGQPAKQATSTVPTQPPAASSGQPVKQATPTVSTQPPAATSGQPAKQVIPTISIQPPAASSGQPAKQATPTVSTQPPAATSGQPAKQVIPTISIQPPAASSGQPAVAPAVSTQPSTASKKPAPQDVFDLLFPSALPKADVPQTAKAANQKPSTTKSGILKSKDEPAAVNKPAPPKQTATEPKAELPKNEDAAKAKAANQKPSTTKTSGILKPKDEPAAVNKSAPPKQTATEPKAELPPKNGDPTKVKVTYQKPPTSKTDGILQPKDDSTAVTKTASKQTATKSKAELPSKNGVTSKVQIKEPALSTLPPQSKTAVPKSEKTQGQPPPPKVDILTRKPSQLNEKSEYSSGFPPPPPLSLPKLETSVSTSPPSTTKSEAVDHESTVLSSSDICVCDKFDLSKEKVECKRYVLVKKFPKGRVGQWRILKKVLKSMATDGYPLTDLEGVHKLPHFSLWMALRCRQFWTMDDRKTMLAFSKQYWIEYDKCRDEIPTEKLKLSRSMAHSMTWGQVKTIKAMTTGLKDRQYRRIKEVLILDGREFFPSMLDYELPTKSFRDCYFAYIPPKEEAIFPRSPWSTFEFRNYSLIRVRKKREGRT